MRAPDGRSPWRSRRCAPHPARACLPDIGDKIRGVGPGIGMRPIAQRGRPAQATIRWRGDRPARTTRPASDAARPRAGAIRPRNVPAEQREPLPGRDPDRPVGQAPRQSRRDRQAPPLRALPNGAPSRKQPAVPATGTKPGRRTCSPGPARRSSARRSPRAVPPPRKTPPAPQPRPSPSCAGGRPKIRAGSDPGEPSSRARNAASKRRPRLPPPPRTGQRAGGRRRPAQCRRPAFRSGSQQ